MSGRIAAILTLIALGIWLTWAALIFKDPQIVFGSVPDARYLNSGQFGDSFGFLSSLMSTLAIIGVLFSIYKQDRNSSKEKFESNFYQLLQSIRMERESISISILGNPTSDKMIAKARYHRLKNALREKNRTYSGGEAVSLYLQRLRDSIGEERYRDSKIVGNEYRKIVANAARIRTYFRLLYHTYSMIDQSNVDDKMFYARILRAHISSNEMCLLAYNCSIDEGRFKFKELVEKYSVLHNIKNRNLDDVESAELKFFQRTIHENAFRFDDFEEYKYG